MTLSPRARDALLAPLCGLVALAVYLRTLYPGLVGDGDTPKFQYVGAILGTPHNPGYPLYVLLSHLVSRLPFGELAWRVNLLSAVCAALAVALLVLALRRLGVARAPACAAALACGFGPVFWSQAILAEVYALAAALLAAVLAAMLRWGASGEPRPAGRLLLAIGLVGLALGHHLTIVCVAPALVAYALAVDRRAALRPRVVLGGALLLALGLCQYLLILVRTRQGAAYLGSRATNLGELFDVVRGAQFAARLFAFDARTVVVERLPLVLRLMRDELTLAGLLLALLGLALLARRRRPEALLLGLGLAGLTGFALNYRVDDTAVFLVPAFVLAWICAGVGLDALLGPLARRSPAAAALVALLLPAAQLGLNFRRSDHSDRTFETRYFRAAFAAMPDGSVVLAETYTVDQMVLYQLHGAGHAARGLRLVTRDPESVAVYAGRGLPLFAFGRAHGELFPLGFRFARVALDDGGAPFPPRAFPLFRLRSLPECAALGDGAWQDVSALARGGVLLARLDNFEPFEARLRLRAWDAPAAAPRIERVAGRGRPRVELRDPARPGAPREVDVRIDDGGDFALLRVGWEGAPRRVEAQAAVDRPEPRRARVCHAEPGDE